MNTIERVRKFKIDNGLRGSSPELFSDISFIMNPRRMTDDPTYIEGPSVPINYAVAGQRVRGSREFDDHDREAMKMFGISEEDYGKHGFTKPEEMESLKLDQTFKERFDQALGLSAEDYALYDH